MQCPIDGETLVMSERSGIEIDYCPKCRGIWLDRGELDKILERGAQEMNLRDREDRRNDSGYEQSRSVSPQKDFYSDFYRDERSNDDRYSEKRTHEKDRYDDRHYDSKKSRKKSFLSDIFEFGD